LIGLINEPTCPADIKEQAQTLLDNFEPASQSSMQSLDDVIQSFYETEIK
jgi:hypothetical protein